MMLRLLKLGCVAVYALAIGSLFGWPQGDLALIVRFLAALGLIVHALEIPFALRHLRGHGSSLAAGIVQTLLFGVLHWLPLARNRTPERN